MLSASTPEPTRTTGKIAHNSVAGGNNQNNIDDSTNTPIKRRHSSSEIRGSGSIVASAPSSTPDPAQKHYIRQVRDAAAANNLLVRGLVSRYQLHGIDNVKHSVSKVDNFLYHSQLELRQFAAECYVIATQLEAQINTMRAEAMLLLHSASSTPSNQSVSMNMVSMNMVSMNMAGRNVPSSMALMNAASANSSNQSLRSGYTGAMNSQKNSTNTIFTEKGTSSRGSSSNTITVSAPNDTTTPRTTNLLAAPAGGAAGNLLPSWSLGTMMESKHVQSQQMNSQAWSGDGGGGGGGLPHQGSDHAGGSSSFGISHSDEEQQANQSPTEGEQYSTNAIPSLREPETSFAACGLASGGSGDLGSADSRTHRIDTSNLPDLEPLSEEEQRLLGSAELNGTLGPAQRDHARKEESPPSGAESSPTAGGGGAGAIRALRSGGPGKTDEQHNDDSQPQKIQIEVDDGAGHTTSPFPQEDIDEKQSSSNNKRDPPPRKVAGGPPAGGGNDLAGTLGPDQIPHKHHQRNISSGSSTSFAFTEEQRNNGNVPSPRDAARRSARLLEHTVLALNRKQGEILHRTKKKVSSDNSSSGGDDGETITLTITKQEKQALLDLAQELEHQCKELTSGLNVPRVSNSSQQSSAQSFQLAQNLVSISGAGPSSSFSNMFRAHTAAPGAGSIDFTPGPAFTPSPPPGIGGSATNPEGRKFSCGNFIRAVRRKPSNLTSEDSTSILCAFSSEGSSAHSAAQFMGSVDTPACTPKPTSLLEKPPLPKLKDFTTDLLEKDDSLVPNTITTDHVEEGEDDAGFQTLNLYTIVGEAGRGSYGTVMFAQTESGEERAIKVIPKQTMKKDYAAALRKANSDVLSQHGSDLAENSKSNTIEVDSPETEKERVAGAKAVTAANLEIELMMKMRHPNVLPLLEVMDDPEKDLVYLVMPYIERGPLLKVSSVGTCTPLDFDVVKGYTRQLVNAVQYLHERHIIHRDIKPENVLLGNDGKVYLSDFGVSKMFKHDQAHEVQELAGTPSFLAPETYPEFASVLSESANHGFDNNPSSPMSPETPSAGVEAGSPATYAAGRFSHLRCGPVEGKPLDVWALGVTVYLMLFGRLPFDGGDMATLKLQVISEPIVFPGEDSSGQESEKSQMDPEEELLRDLLKQMLVKDPRERASIRECCFHPAICREKKANLDPLKRRRGGKESSPVATKNKKPEGEEEK